MQLLSNPLIYKIIHWIMTLGISSEDEFYMSISCEFWTIPSQERAVAADLSLVFVSPGLSCKGKRKELLTCCDKVRTKGNNTTEAQESSL